MERTKNVPRQRNAPKTGKRHSVSRHSPIPDPETLACFPFNIDKFEEPCAF